MAFVEPATYYRTTATPCDAAPRGLLPFFLSLLFPFFSLLFSRDGSQIDGSVRGRDSLPSFATQTIFNDRDTCTEGGKGRKSCLKRERLTLRDWDWKREAIGFQVPGRLRPSAPIKGRGAVRASANLCAILLFFRPFFLFDIFISSLSFSLSFSPTSSNPFFHVLLVLIILTVFACNSSSFSNIIL